MNNDFLHRDFPTPYHPYDVWIYRFWNFIFLETLKFDLKKLVWITICLVVEKVARRRISQSTAIWQSKGSTATWQYCNHKSPALRLIFIVTSSQKYSLKYLCKCWNLLGWQCPVETHPDLWQNIDSRDTQYSCKKKFDQYFMQKLQPCKKTFQFVRIAITSW